MRRKGITVGIIEIRENCSRAVDKLKINPKKLITPRTIPLFIIGFIVLRFRKKMPKWLMRWALYESKRLAKKGIWND